MSIDYTRESSINFDHTLGLVEYYKPQQDAAFECIFIHNVFLQLESSAFYARPSSSSDTSNVVEIHDSPFFVSNPFGDEFTKADDMQAEYKYNLKELVGDDCEYFIKAVRANGKQTRLSENVAFMWLEQVLQDDVVFEVDSQVMGISWLSDIFSSTRERVDIAIYNEVGTRHRLVLGIEVQSSQMIFTLRKATYFAANAVRLLRYEDPAFDQFTVFAIPSIDASSCIVKVNVQWKDLVFFVTLTCYQDAQDGIDEIRKVVQSQLEVPFLPTTECYYPYPIRLNKMDMVCNFGTPLGIQLHTTKNIVVEVNNEIYKVIYSTTDSGYLKLLGIDYSNLPRGSVGRFIKPVQTSLKRHNKYDIYKYIKVKYSSLTCMKAKQCLKELTLSIKNALDDLHSFELSHNDIRLPNICFNANYEAILIDVDRCAWINSLHPMFGGAQSCMYKIKHFKQDKKVTGAHTDYMQLGWLVAFILDNDGHTNNEHLRDWDTQPDYIKECKLINSLINTGEWNQIYYDEWKLEGQLTMQEVIDNNA